MWFLYNNLYFFQKTFYNGEFNYQLKNKRKINLGSIDELPENSIYISFDKLPNINFVFVKNGMDQCYIFIKINYKFKFKNIFIIFNDAKKI